VFLAYCWILGRFPPGEKSLRSAYRVAVNMVRAHAAAYRAIHSLQPQARVGMAMQYRIFQPDKAWFPLDHFVANTQDGMFNQLFSRTVKDGKLRFSILHKRIPEAKGTQDFLGLNYYTRERVAFSLLRPQEAFGRRFFPPGADLSDSGDLANDPEGLYQALKWARKFNLPIIITENGVDDADDDLRPRYLAAHIHQMWRAVNFNWPIKGYFHWTLTDNFEWERGWTQRFGLWELDVETQARRKRPSADLYAEICRENGLSAEMVAKYAPEILEKLFP